MPRPPLAQPLFFFFVLLILGGAGGALVSFWWTARWHERDVEAAAAVAAESPQSAPASEESGTPGDGLPLVADSEWENRPGWKWLLEPVKPSVTAGTPVGIITFSRSENGLDAFLARSEKSAAGPLGPRFAAAAFDEDGGFLAAAEMMSSAHSSGVTLRRFRFWPGDVAVEDVASVGIEVLTPDAWRSSARDARKEALAAGIRTLPFPELGEPYPFALDLPDGGTISSADYEGRVVLFDCWASWCAPCMAKMPDLREAYARYHDRGLEIIGVNLDVDAASAEKAIAEDAPDWPHVLVGAEPDVVKAWQEITTIRSIPRFFLVGRDGTLRWDSTNVAADSLTRAIEECLAG
jgi:thiol-disulfide isomerase/thioredoxin